jgi:hypothetical protein
MILLVCTLVLHEKGTDDIINTIIRAYLRQELGDVPAGELAALHQVAPERADGRHDGVRP